MGAGSGSGDVTYTTAVDEAVQLDNASFNDYCKDVTGYNFESIWFTPPATKYGRLYYNYTSSSRYGYVVDSNDEFYRSSTPYLSDVTFVPASGYTGTLEIPFAGVSTNNKSFSGTLVVKVGAEAKTITYSTAANTAVRLDEDDFIDYCKAVTGYTFNYVTFDLPSSSRGVLYYDYSAGSSSNTKVTSNTKYYRTSKPYADYVTFVPASNYTGTVSISFTGYSSNSTKFTGTLKIYVGKNAGDVSYTAPLTRQDAMLLIQRTVQATGGIMNNGTALALSGFSDRASVASYAQGAVSALVQAGIIKGSNGMLNPTSYLTRAEMATILHRVLTM